MSTQDKNFNNYKIAVRIAGLLQRSAKQSFDARFISCNEFDICYSKFVTTSIHSLTPQANIFAFFHKRLQPAIVVDPVCYMLNYTWVILSLKHYFKHTS